MDNTLIDLDKIEFNHKTPIQIRFNDIDVIGHVNNAVQLTYFDLGKVKYFETLKKQVLNWREAELVMVNINVDFIHPIYMGEEVVVKTKVYEIGNKSVKLIQVLYDEKSGEVRSICKSVMCGFDTKTLKSVVISDEWRNLINQYERFRP